MKGKIFAVSFAIVLYFSCSKERKSQPNKSPLCPDCYSIIVFPPPGAFVFKQVPVAGISFHPNPITRVKIALYSDDRIEDSIEVEPDDGRRWRAMLKVSGKGTFKVLALAWDSQGFESSDSVTVVALELDPTKLMEYLGEVSGYLGEISGYLTNLSDVFGDLSNLKTFLARKYTSILVPADGQTIFGITPVVGISFPPSPTAVLLEVKGNGVSQTYSLPASFAWSFMLNTFKIPDGVLSLKAMSFWDDGGSSSHSITAVVSNSSVPQFEFSVSQVLQGVTEVAGIFYPPDGATMPSSLCSAYPKVCNAVGFFISEKVPASVTVYVSVQRPTFEEDIKPLFLSNCASCHPSLSPPDVLDYNLLIAGFSLICAGRKYIVPLKPSESYLFQKILGSSGICGSRMPPSSYLSQNEVNLIRNWIEEGAGKFLSSQTISAQVFPEQKFPFSGTFVVPTWWVSSGRGITGKAQLKVYLNGKFVQKIYITLLP